MEPYVDNIKMLVAANTGYTIPDTDTGLLTYLYTSEQQDILNDCNLSVLPTGLLYVVEERVAGRYLQIRKSAIIGDDGFDVVKSVKEGDTTVDLGGTSAETRLDAIIAAWLKERDVSCYRKLRW